MSSQFQAEDIHQRETRSRQHCANLLCEIDKLAFGMEVAPIRLAYQLGGFRFEDANSTCTQTFLSETKAAISNLLNSPFHEGGPLMIVPVLEAVVQKLDELRRNNIERLPLPSLPHSTMPDAREFVQATEAVAA